jgi:lipoprotein-releasing system ATP-binding protein
MVRKLVKPCNEVDIQLAYGIESFPPGMTQEKMPDFVADRVVKEFETPAGRLRILDGISLALNRGDNLAVVGPSGSGKSTFLHIAGTLDWPTSGTVNLLGVNPVGFGERQLAAFRNKNIGFIFQEHHLLPQLSALENVLIPMIPTGSTGGDGLKRARMLLESVELADRMDHLPAMLSGGERQRVAVARALIQKPALLLADEPTGSLDQRNADIVGRLLLDLQAQDPIILICVTHSDRLAQSFQNQVRLENGRLVDL